MFEWKRKNLATGKEEIARVQGALRPIQLWEYVFPEECIDEVLEMMGDGWKLGKTKEATLRKMLGNGVKKIPKQKNKSTNYRYIEKRGVAIYPIGIKKDRRQKWEEVGYEQEML